MNLINVRPLVGKIITLVGMTGFEPATSWSQTKRSTKLTYIPIRADEARLHYFTKGCVNMT